MCNFLSAIVTKDGTIMHHPATDSHSELIAYFRLMEGRAGNNFIRVEFSPAKKKYLDIDRYRLKVDETRTPDWFDESTEEKTAKYLRGVVKDMIVDDERALLGGVWILAKTARVTLGRCCRIVFAEKGADLSRADLRGANLNGADLRGADLSRADLRGADLSGANLSGSALSWADLIGADLNGANLSWADLSRADLRGANLIGADLRGANLIGADLSRADLRGANLNGADLSGADLSGADLSGAYRPTDLPKGYDTDEFGYLRARETKAAIAK